MVGALDPREIEAIKEQARQGADIAAMKEDIREVRKDVERVIREIRELTKFVDETRGGKKWLWGIISAAAALGTIAGAILKGKIGF